MKSPFQSKMQWFHAALILLGALEASIGVLSPVIGAKGVAITLFICGFGGGFLRQITTEPVQSFKDALAQYFSK